MDLAFTPEEQEFREDIRAWVRDNLPKDISVHWAVKTTPQFHCRASAKSRRYAYVLLESPIRPSIEGGRVAAGLAVLRAARRDR